MKPICKECNTPLEANAKYCVWCGVRLPESVIPPLSATSACATENLCTSCGKPIYPDSEFCIYCGAKKAIASSTSSDTPSVTEKTASSLVMPTSHAKKTISEPSVLQPKQLTASSFSAADDFDN